MTNSNGKDIFDGLFVIEIARNHWGSIERGKNIIKTYSDLAKKHNIKAAIKMQVFDFNGFIHKDSKLSDDELNDGENTQAPGTHSRYIKKLQATEMSKEDFKVLVDEIKANGLIAMAAPYDENSIQICEDIGIEYYKLASHETASPTMIEGCIKLGKPFVISTGIIDLKVIDRVVKQCADAGVPLAINHCVSNYPSEDNEIELNQIDFLKNRYPDNVIGFSAHDFHNRIVSHTMAYMKGARTFERHVDVEQDGVPVSSYCMTPEQTDVWLAAHNTMLTMLGGSSEKVRSVTDMETTYLQSVARGLFAKRDLPKGHIITAEGLNEDFYTAIPCEPGQLHAHHLDRQFELLSDIKADGRIIASETKQV